MQNPKRPVPGPGLPEYRERLSPSLWLLLVAALAGPMIALVFVPVGSAVALLLGIAASVLAILLAVALSPTVTVHGTLLRAGRARIDARWIGDPQAFTAEQAREARGPGLPARGWHLLRGGIDGVVIFPITDPADPAPSWTISSRTPDRLAAAVQRARSAASR